MNLMTRFEAALKAFRSPEPEPPAEQRSGPPGAFSSGTSWYGGPMFTDPFQTKRAPSPYQLVESYKSIAYACAQINAMAVSRIPLRLYCDSSNDRAKPKAISGPRSIDRSLHAHLRGLTYVRGIRSAKVDDVDEVTNHPLLDCLDNPADTIEGGMRVGYMSREDLISLISRYVDIVGCAYLKPDGISPKLPPQRLWPLFSQYVLPVPRAGSPLVDSYTYFAETIPVGDLIRFRGTISLRDPYKASYSPHAASVSYREAEDEFTSLQSQIMGSGPRPNVLVTPKDSMMPPGEPERTRLDQDLNRRHAGANAGKAIVTNGAYDIKPINYSPTDLAGLELSNYNLERVCNDFGVPIALMVRESNLANLEAANVQHARNVVEPRCRMIAATLTKLAQRYDERLFFAFDPALPEDEERKAKIVDMRLKNGSITINEANEELPYPPKPWGNEPWLASGLTQPSMIAEDREAAAAEPGDSEDDDEPDDDFEDMDEDDVDELLGNAERSLAEINRGFARRLGLGRDD